METCCGNKEKTYTEKPAQPDSKFYIDIHERVYMAGYRANK